MGSIFYKKNIYPIIKLLKNPPKIFFFIIKIMILGVWALPTANTRRWSCQASPAQVSFQRGLVWPQDQLYPLAGGHVYGWICSWPGWPSSFQFVVGQKFWKDLAYRFWWLFWGKVFSRYNIEYLWKKTFSILLVLKY